MPTGMRPEEATEFSVDGWAEKLHTSLAEPPLATSGLEPGTQDAQTSEVRPSADNSGNIHPSPFKQNKHLRCTRSAGPPKRAPPSYRKLECG